MAAQEQAHADAHGQQDQDQDQGTDTGADAAWEARVAQAWAALDDEEPEAFRARIRALGAERPPGDAAALFEVAAAHDSTGQPQHAEPLYRQALGAGLTGPRRRRAVIQLASTLRNLGHPQEGVELLEAERASGASDELDDAVVCVLALNLARLGRAQESVGLLVEAMAAHLPRYNRSMAAYGAALADQARADADATAGPAAGPGAADPAQ